MDDDEFGKAHRTADLDGPDDGRDLHPKHAEKWTLSTPSKNPRDNAVPSFTNPAGRGGPPGILWVRFSDLLSSGTGRIAGRGIDFETELARRIRRTPAATRRAIRERADRLPPLSEFGQSSEHPPITRYGLGRR